MRVSDAHQTLLRVVHYHGALYADDARFERPERSRYFAPGGDVAVDCRAEKRRVTSMSPGSFIGYRRAYRCPLVAGDDAQLTYSRARRESRALSTTSVAAADLAAAACPAITSARRVAHRHAVEVYARAMSGN